MVSDQRLGRTLSLAATLSACVLALSGCHYFQNKPRDEAPAPVATTAPAGGPASAEVAAEQNAIDAALARGESGDTSSSTDSSAGGSSSMILPTAPKSYTVKRGDTLWGISSMFLRDPWLWPEIWYVNPEVRNPHLIYPGDVLALAYGADGSPQIRLTRGSALRVQPLVRSSPLDGPIATIPYEAIAAFLSRPSVVSREDAKKAPRILALRDGHIVAANGHEVYVRGLPGEPSERYSVVQIGEELRDPDDKAVLGYMGIYASTAHIEKPGKTAKAVLSDAKRETLQGDLLFSEDVTAPASFTPHSPASDISGEIIAVVDGISLIGQYQVVAINRGTRHGIEPGHVLVVDDAGEQVRDRCHPRNGPSRCMFGPGEKVRLPDERAGTLMIFKTFDRMSYGLVVATTQPIRVTDHVRKP